jgi:hypothetical protein
MQVAGSTDPRGFEEMLTMRPLPCARITGATAWAHTKTPVTFTAGRRSTRHG